ncbi:hypothetical protein QJS04_geneDACA022328 [Acorus gramineus]|uniref:Uncharacterized protein n=1 Tax=Acorus gramineus TaxID=55184 RepID=A0AAV9AIX9_ACOGR|nr:hypothetical protein QJS04_geneDACA022328 [Acorus gramineus]
MHMQLLRNNKVLIFDRTSFGPSFLPLPTTSTSNPTTLCPSSDCTAHSLLLDPTTLTLSPLHLHSDTFCSSASPLPDGTLLQSGGFSSRGRSLRLLRPCPTTPSSSSSALCDWLELPNYLSVRRWYSSDQSLPDGRVIILGGRRQFSYEFFPKDDGGVGGVHAFDFLRETTDAAAENNLYPFLHLLPDGNLFVLANARAVLLDYLHHRVLREFPPLRQQHPRTYPSSGASVLLPLFVRRFQGGGYGPVDAEVMVCGGARRGAYEAAVMNASFWPALSSCGRLRIGSDGEAEDWVMEEMPSPRVMGEMVLMPTGEEVLILNGAGNGTAGWELGRDPVLEPVMYRPRDPPGERFRRMRAARIPRMYHSASVLLPDGRVLVGGSNPHVYYNFTGVVYPTELSVEAYSPPYLGGEYSLRRPRVIRWGSDASVGYRDVFEVGFMIAEALGEVSVVVVAPAFATHGVAMNQRVVVLPVVDSVSQVGPYDYRVSVGGPPTPEVAPPGYYLMFVVHGGVPSEGVWVRFQ